MTITADAKSRTDGSGYSLCEKINNKYPIVLVSRTEHFEFNTELLKLKKYILVCFCEYGANDWDRKETHLFGKNTDKFTYAFAGDEWKKFDDWVKSNPPLLYFKRELLKADATDTVLPIEYPCIAPKFEPQGKQEYLNRPIELFNYWGWSHEARRVFHGRAWEHAAKTGIYLVDNLSYISHAVNDCDSQRLWVSVNIPSYARIDMNIIYNFIGNSKLCLSLPGAGIKCFRSSEIPVNSIMVLQDDPLEWTYEWVHGVNCIRVPIGTDMESIKGTSGDVPEIPAIEEALKRTDLWKIYLQGMATVDKYRIENYVPYLENLINNA